MDKSAIVIAIACYMIMFVICGVLAYVHQNWRDNKMKAVSIKNMFVEDYAEWLYDYEMPFLGRDKCIDHNHTLYMPLDVACELGYSILDNWVEEI